MATNTTTVGFEQKLWDAADKLRSNMDAAEYKHVVLGLIFLKYVSDSFTEKYEQLKAEGYGDEEDRDEYMAENIFWVPQQARWEVLKAHATNPDIGEVIDKAMDAIEKENEILKGVLTKNYARPELDKVRLGELVTLFSNIEVGSSAAQEKDVLGRVYIKWLDEGFNYLGIGNSLTLHGITSFWWNEVGMAASDAEHDYFHIVSASLKNTHPNFMSVPYNFSVWETQSHDRDETLEYLDHYLSSKLNLITIQLAENASDLTTYQEDYVSLINYVKSKAPNARILVIGDFWSHNNRNDLKIKAVNETGVEYVSLEGIADNADYYCGLGTIVYDNEGNEHKVEHSGVAHG